MKHKAFTMMELLVVVCIFTVLSVGLVLLINPLSVINKGNDITRKKDLDNAKKMLEQYMNDTGCYPKPTQVCADGGTSSTCHICTKDQSPSFSYFTKDICDPRHGGGVDYLYETK